MRIIGLAALLCVACGTAPSTRIELTVETDYAAPGEIDAIVIDVDSGSIGGTSQQARLDLAPNSAGELPARLGLTHRAGAPLGPLLITARAMRGPTEVASTTTEAFFVLDEAIAVVMRIERECTPACATEERCEAGSCVPRMADAGVLDAGMLDGGMLDAGVLDAGTDGGAPDAGPEVCVEPMADCTAAPGCETDLDETTAHCGQCDHDCRDLPNVGNVQCGGGRCILFGPPEERCQPGFYNCNLSALDGCECATACAGKVCG